MANGSKKLEEISVGDYQLGAHSVTEDEEEIPLWKKSYFTYFASVPNISTSVMAARARSSRRSVVDTVLGVNNLRLEVPR